MAPALASVAREAVLGQSLSDHPGRLASFGCEPNMRSEYKGRHARFRTSSIRSPSERHKSLLCPKMTWSIFLFFWHQDPASACHLGLSQPNRRCSDQPICHSPRARRQRAGRLVVQGPLLDHLAASVACDTNVSEFAERGMWLANPGFLGLVHRACGLLAGPRSASHREDGNLGKAEFPTLLALGSISLVVPTCGRRYLTTRRGAGSARCKPLHQKKQSCVPFWKQIGAC